MDQRSTVDVETTSPQPNIISQPPQQQIPSDMPQPEQQQSSQLPQQVQLSNSTTDTITSTTTTMNEDDDDKPFEDYYVLPTDGDNLADETADMYLETTSIGRMDRDPCSSSSDDDDSSDDSSIDDDDSDDSDDDPLNLYSNEEMLNLVQEMMKTANDDFDDDGGIGMNELRTQNEISDEFLHINKVDNLQLPPQEYIDQIPPNLPIIPGLQPLGTIMNIFSHKIILKPWGAKSSIFTSSDDDDSDNDYDKINHRNHNNKQNNKHSTPINPNAAGTIASTEDLATLMTLQLQTPIFNKRGEGIGRLSDIIGHVQFPFFVVSFHNHVTNDDVSITNQQTQPQEQLSTLTSETTSSQQPTINNDKMIEPPVGNHKDDDDDDQIVQVEEQKMNQKGKKVAGPNAKKSQNKIQYNVTYYPIPQLSNNETVYYLPSLTSSIKTQTLVGKGTDASNFFDEEINASDQEFSDDELERAHKQKITQLKKQNRNHDGQDLNQQNKKNNNKKNKNNNTTNNNNTNKFTTNNLTHGKYFVPQTLDFSTPSNLPPPPPPSTVPTTIPAAPATTTTTTATATTTSFLPPPPPPPPLLTTPISDQFGMPTQAPSNPYNSQSRQQHHQQPPQQQQQQQQQPSQPTNPYATSQPPAIPQHQNDPSYQNILMLNQYKLLTSNGFPLTADQSQHFAYLSSLYPTDQQ